MSEEANSHIVETIKVYGKKLLGFIRKRVKSDEDAEDILQDVWYQFSAIVNSVPVEQTGAWLYRVARNKIIDKHKKKSEASFDDVPDDEENEGSMSFKDVLMDPGNDPESEYLQNLFWDQLFLALDELPEDQKMVFIWQELEGLSFQEIADTTGVNINTLVSRKRYAVLHLRGRLHQLYKEITMY